MTRGRWVCNVSTMVDRLIARNATRVVAMTVAASMAMLCAAVPAQAGLPENRAYEMVSPPFKEGYAATAIRGVAPDGESVAFGTIGAFSGAPANTGALNTFLARRTIGGWLTAPLAPPAMLAPWFPGRNPVDLSSDLGASLDETMVGENYGQGVSQGTEALFLLHASSAPDTEAGFALASPLLRRLSGDVIHVGYESASPDLSHIIFGIGPDGPSQALLPEGQEMSSPQQPPSDLYEIAGADGPAPVLRLVGLDNQRKVIDPYCPVDLGSGGAVSVYNAVAAGGAEIFFTTNANQQAGSSCDWTQSGDNVPANPAILYVRVNGAKTLQVSGRLDWECAATEPCHGAPQARALFQGANTAGTKAFFITAQPLVNGDVDTGNDLYMATIEDEEVKELVQVSHDPNPGQAAEVQGRVVRISADGSHVYFVASGVLSGENAESQAPAPGADNLYVYDTIARQTKFIADLCSGPVRSGGVPDPQCGANLNSEYRTSLVRNDSGLWSTAQESQTTGDGRFLVFSSYARLTGDDTDTARDVYRYDSQTGRLERVSLGEGGYDVNGNNSAFDASIPAINLEANTITEMNGLGARAISEDGSRIVFATSEPLSPDATNGQQDVYIWHEGRVGLISSGVSSSADENQVITPFGHDVFFRTAQGLLPQDTDGVPDVYDARVGGGFPLAFAPRSACSADACQGPLSAAPAPLTPGSISQQAGGNIPVVKPAPKIKRLTRAQKLAKALKACAKKSRAGRRRCEAQARRKYGNRAPAKAMARKSSRRGK
jgi:hypothetical protein